MTEEEFIYKEDKEPEDVYTEEGVEEELNEDEITAGEAGLMEGYDEIEDLKCDSCGKTVDVEHLVEREVKGKLYLFCSKECADKFEEKQE